MLSSSESTLTHMDRGARGSVPVAMAFPNRQGVGKETNFLHIVAKFLAILRVSSLIVVTSLIVHF